MTAITPVDVAVWGTSNQTPGVYQVSMPQAGSGFIDARGFAADQTSGTYPFMDTANEDASWVASHGVSPNPVSGDSSDSQVLVCRFPATTTTPADIAVTIQYEIISPDTPGADPGTHWQFLEFYSWSAWTATIGTGRNSSPPTPAAWSFGALHDTFPVAPWPAGWQTFRSTGHFPPEALALLAAGDLAIAITNQYAVDYSFRVSFLSLGPAVRPPLRQRQRSDGLAASGAPRHHQHSTLQTSNRQRAVR